MTLRTQLGSVAIIITVCSILILGFMTLQKINVKKLAQRKMNHVSDLPLVSTDSLKFNLSLINQSVILLFFHPDCEHCQNEAAGIESRKYEFSEATLVWVSSATISSIRVFSEKYGLNSLPNFHFTKIDPEKVFEIFGALSVPHIFVYNHQGSLTREFKGEAPVDSLLHQLSN